MNERKLQEELAQLDNRRAAGQITAAEYLYRRETLLTPQPQKAKPRWLLPILISLAVVVVLAAGGGAGGYYLAVYRPHVQAVASAASSKAAYESQYRSLYKDWHDDDIRLTGLEQDLNKTVATTNENLPSVQAHCVDLLDSMKMALYQYAIDDRRLSKLQKQGGVGDLIYSTGPYQSHYSAVTACIDKFNSRVFDYTVYQHRYNPSLPIINIYTGELPDYKGSL